jgi:hypothetical protein
VSKASEWARTVDSQRPIGSLETDLIFDGAGATALVTSWPVFGERLTILRVGGYSHPTFTSAEALELARWILDTFGEPEQAP